MELEANIEDSWSGGAEGVSEAYAGEESRKNFRRGDYSTVARMTVPGLYAEGVMTIPFPSPNEELRSQRMSLAQPVALNRSRQNLRNSKEDCPNAAAPASASVTV